MDDPKEVREAVEAALKYRRAFTDHWYYYMSPESHEQFGLVGANALQNFKQQCERRYAEVLK